MSTPPDPEPPPEQPYELPGTSAAWEPDTLPEHPLRAEDCLPLCGKDIA